MVRMPQTPMPPTSPQATVSDNKTAASVSGASAAELARLPTSPMWRPPPPLSSTDHPGDLGGLILHQAACSLQQMDGNRVDITGDRVEITGDRVEIAPRGMEPEVEWRVNTPQTGNGNGAPDREPRAGNGNGAPDREDTRWDAALEGGLLRVIDVGWPKGLQQARDALRRRVPVVLRNAALAFDLDEVQEELGSLEELGRRLGDEAVSCSLHRRWPH